MAFAATRVVGGHAGVGGIFGMGVREWGIFALFGVGAVIMRAAGCVINDLWDRDLDKMVERTQDRPLAAGTVSIKQASVFLATLLLIGLTILLQLNTTTILLGFITIPLIVSYPLMKRITWWPQAFLGLTFNFSALMGWTAVTGEIGLPAILLYAAGIFWTLGYDTIYAHQDKEDDVMAGIKSTALKFGTHSKLWICGFYVACFICLAIVIIDVTGEYYYFYLPSLIAPALYIVWKLKTWQPEDPASSLKVFKSNRDFGFLVLAVFALG